MNNGLLLICFDINNSHAENKENDNTENLPESPFRIMSEYFSNHKYSNLERQEISNSKISYKFKVELKEVSSFYLFIISDLNFIHEICMEADGYLVFINLEDKDLEKKLKFLIRYIKEGCSEQTKIYFVGLYKDVILPDFQKEKLENLFNDKNLYFEYFQVKYNMNDTLNKIHNCLNETFNEDNNNKKKSQLNIIEEKHEYKIQEMIERIFIKLYENKMGVIYDHNKKKFITKNSKEEDNSNSNCNIF